VSADRDHEHRDGDPRPEDELRPEVTGDELLAQSRDRPPDLVGTRPEWDPATLVPAKAPRAAAGRLWAPAGGEDAEVVPAAAAVADPEAAAGDAAAPAVPAVDAPRYSRYSARFQFLFGALIAVGAAAVVLLVAVIAGGGKDDTTIALRSGPAWSSWQPTATGLDAAGQIAEHVGHEYHLPNGKQLVIVTGGPLALGDLPATIAIQQPADQGGDIDFLDGSSVLYRMCGTQGLKCRVSGEPSPNRHMLLRREALELALYSFRYLGVSDAVVILPPGVLSPGTPVTKTTSTQTQALLFRRSQSDVQTAIVHPLVSTLTPKAPTIAGVSRSPDASLVTKLTNTKVFDSKFQLANQDLRAFLVLDPHPIG